MSERATHGKTPTVGAPATNRDVHSQDVATDSHPGSTPLSRTVLIALLAVAVMATAATTTARAAKTGTRASTSTTAGLKKATWGANITASYGSGTIRLRSNGIPNHAMLAQYALPDNGVMVPTAATAHAGSNPTIAQNIDFTLPTVPAWSATTTIAPMGAIGLMISGAVLFNPYEGDGGTVAMANNFTVTGSDGTKVPFVDACSGHPTPQGMYHYHGLPACVTAEVDTGKGPSHLIGIAFDGYPIYGDRNAKGAKVPASKLDRCNGITSATPEFPKGIYHYVLPGTATATSSIRCFHGKVSASLMTRLPRMTIAMMGGTSTAHHPIGTSARALVCDLRMPAAS